MWWSMRRRRRMPVKPLFQALAKDPQWGRKIAADLYPKVRSLYHPMVTRDLDKLKLGG